MRAPALRERGGKQARHAVGIVGLRQIADDLRMAEVEPTGRGLVAIALFGDRERHDPRLARRKSLPDPGVLRFLKQHFAHAADDTPPHARGALLDRGVQAILWRQPIAHVRRAQAHTANAPVATGVRDGVVGVDRLMRAMERADAEMDDARGERVDRIPRSRDAGRQARERMGIEPIHAKAPRPDSP